MEFDWDKVTESKKAYRRKLAGLPIAEKLRLLEELNQRAVTIKQARDKSAVKSRASPSGCRRVPLGSVICPRREKVHPSAAPTARYIGMEHVEAHSTRILETAPAYGMRSSANRFYSGDILYGRLRPYLNKVCRPDFSGLCSAEFIVLPKTEGMDPDFLKYRLNAADFVHFASHLNAGDRPRVDFDQLAGFEIMLPPLDEQRRIVAEIEKQFTRLDAGVASLKRVQIELKRHRASVLKAACEGRLVLSEAELARKENRSYETGEELLERILRERREKWNGKGKYKEPPPLNVVDLAQLPEGWAWATVEQLNPPDRACAYGVLQPGPDSPNGIPIVRVGDINNGKLDQRNLKLISPKIAAQYPRTKLQGGEVAVSLVGAIGRTAVIPKALVGANTARAVGIIPLTKFVTSDWVEIWFRNPRKIAEMTSKSHEVARKTLNLEDVRAALVALPPVAEQDRITAEVERRLSIIDEMELVVSTSVARAGRLRNAILTVAFNPTT